MIFDDRPCKLGEGPLWHPLREQLFWFDILGKRLLTRGPDGPADWAMGEHASAAGWLDHDRLLIASESALFNFDLRDASRRDVVALEADKPGNRSNDGRADPAGGFWIGTMDKNAERGEGAIYRFHKGELRRLFAGLSITNAICFRPDGRTAHFADTVTGKVMMVALDAEGWPSGEPSVFLDLSGEGRNPDGAVVDADGIFWLAEWGSSRVAGYAPDGSFLEAIDFPAPHTSCPAFGGENGRTLFCTTALQGMSQADRAACPDAGKTFEALDVAEGQREHQVIL